MFGQSLPSSGSGQSGSRRGRSNWKVAWQASVPFVEFVLCFLCSTWLSPISHTSHSVLAIAVTEMEYSQIAGMSPLLPRAANVASVTFDPVHGPPLAPKTTGSTGVVQLPPAGISPSASRHIAFFVASVRL